MLSAESFVEGIQSLAQHSASGAGYVGSPWSLVTSAVPQGVFLQKRDVLRDNPECPQLQQQTPHVYEFHIVYSPTFNVPLLLFRGSTFDGTPLTYEESWNDIPAAYRLDESRGFFVTQLEHPFLGLPFYYIHPCNTATLMAALMQGATDWSGS
eukprot:gnl/Hemi2/11751_TR4031_c0_g1_i2.p1 gnl/Hemi2/11751_TR4031_c0_g1~~gnl/Hemi2/11751_TR4031_c0_g1_i2.p1  ORF type:complete len:171 (-),score=43.87 gnl/Hemi2/11751_TR4031_c0_g1_i2:25-483(-)